MGGGTVVTSVFSNHQERTLTRLRKVGTYWRPGIGLNISSASRYQIENGVLDIPLGLNKFQSLTLGSSI